MAGSPKISALQQALLGKKILRETYQNAGVFQGLIEVITDTHKKFPTEGKPIVVRNDLKDYKGSLSQIITMIGKLDGDITEGDNTLKGNETPISQYTQEVAIKQGRKAVREEGYEEEFSSPVKFFELFKPMLAEFMGEYKSKDYVRKLAGAISKTFANTPTAATTNRVLYGGDASSTATIEAGDELTDVLIKKAHTMGGNQFLTGTDVKYIPPLGKINFGGKQRAFYLNLVQPDVYDDYLTSANVQQKFRETAALQKDNPLLFADDIVQYGVVTRRCELLREPNVGTFTNWGSGGALTGAISLFLGQGALACSEGDAAKYISDMDDYENIKGIAWRNLFGCQKARFNGQDLAVIAIKTIVTGL